MKNKGISLISTTVGKGLILSSLPWVLSVIFLIFLPFLFSSNSSITIMNQMAITIVFALAYNMLLGQGGMLSFGHAVYMGFGGFACVHSMNYVAAADLPVPLPILPIIGGLFSLGLATIIGAFSTRKAGTVFAMISLGVGELIAACSIIIVAFFGGEEGVSADRTHMQPFFNMDFISQTEVYYLTVFWLLFSTVFMYVYTLTPIGCIAKAVRDNPERAEFLGYSARWVRFYSFCASGFFCGVAGGLFAINFEILSEENLNLTTSGTILLITFLGGVGFFFGPILGAIVFTMLQSILSLQTELWQLYLGILFVATVMFFPGGLAGLIMMHKPILVNGEGSTLVKPYLTTIFSGILSILAIAGVCELLYHVRHSPVGDVDIKLFWVQCKTNSPIPWLVFLSLAILGLWMVKQTSPKLKSAWDQAVSNQRYKL